MSLWASHVIDNHDNEYTRLQMESEAGYYARLAIM